MGINLSTLKVPQEGAKKVREHINSPQGTIEIYEPTMKDADAILEMQREEGFDFGSDRIVFSEALVLKRLFPMLTNINTADISDEELEKIVMNPSVHLLIAQNYVAQIVSEVNKLYVERIKTEIISADSVMAQTEIITSIPTMMIEHAKRNPELQDVLQKVEEATNKFDEAVEKEKQDEQEI